MQGADPLDGFRVDVDYDRNHDPYLIHDPCQETVCTVEHDDTLAMLVGTALDHQCPPAYPGDALDYDLAEALGLDGTGRDDHPNAPYRWSDPWVQEFVRSWVLAHQQPF